ncbi:DnaJ domain-containing protein [Solirubrobacter phytolaccae]|uniref:DnaJ domain-containing protein n=1 Tax=Solirubrobacter phytolaccae TaxID=1404360 RepID=A0A9X3N3G3_9ACTN|nr:J domain-containing protein [Solirubrobacter phytolaccae]MDA0179008.1 DnaJ domain-containing protein [Solirubrobacter phytolaccae]
MPQVLDIEQSVLLLEIEPPFDKRDIQKARRKLAKVWHPDIAPPGRQLEHERHLKAINQAADQLESLAEQSRGGKVSKNAVKVSAAAARKRRAEEGARAYAEEQRQRAEDGERQKHDPFGSRVPDHSVVHRYARCLSYPEWGVGSVNGIYFTGHGDDVQQWARVSFQPGIRTVPAGSLQFVDFSKPDPGAERVMRFMTAAKHALAEGDFKLAARRLVFARDAEPDNTQVLRLMTLAFWQAGDFSAAARSVRDWIRAEKDRPAPYRYAARIYESMGALSQAVDAGQREVAADPTDASAWERLGRLRMRTFDREGAREALDHARAVGPSEEGLMDLALVANLMGDVGTEVSACEQATQLFPESETAWARYAHALARTDRVSDCLEACERALKLADDPEVRDLRDQVARLAPRELKAA